MWRLKKDGEWKGPKWLSYPDAWMGLLRWQGQSVYHATQYEGWSIERCSPLTRTGVRRIRCGCGVPSCPGVWRGR